MTPVPRQGWLFSIDFKNGISRNSGKCELGGFSLRQSHIEKRYCNITIHHYIFSIFMIVSDVLL